MSVAYLEHIVSRSDVCGGKPCIRGTRMRVRDVLEYMAGGDSVDDLLGEFPFITRADIMACLAFAADHSDFPVLAAAE
ncbi:hypothetical protein GCM10011529_23830 [Polymorphobacter glacialis]|uniref:DUF433 domain-containing protein n=1 Tax=Sandarakinorhabdus glacialis TaxID=1614636 RepID=A0A916ZX18_9SPHN|nr:DUF433 domain-containing protein [Polymorphobacter glacialis]GGE16609.1 hypothetical protein GCM10011529_23830 [Polymorphobacter glacialis]